MNSTLPLHLLPFAPVKKFQQYPDLIGATAVTFAPGTGPTKIDGKQGPPDADVYMTYFGNSIDNLANANFCSFQIRVNGSPYKPPFDRITSQIGAANLPTKFAAPFLLGRGVNVEIFGTVTAGAAGNTQLIVQMGLLYTAPGVQPE